MVIPRSRSSSLESITRSATCSFWRKMPLCRSMASTSVVFPWSTCAMIAILRMVWFSVTGITALPWSHAGLCRPSADARNCPAIMAFVAEQEVLPTVVIVGRPNVGKSTLFNSIIGQRRSIVGDEPGMTRDRIHGRAVHQGRPFELIDTGGIIPNDAEMIPSQILRQARVALDRAANIIFVIDGRAEITAADRDLAQMLRQLGRPVTLAVNKIDSPRREDLLPEFYTLGFGDVYPVSAEHRLGIDDMLDHVTAAFPGADGEPHAPEKLRIKVAIIGRPNVGKSTLLNALVGAERSIVTPIAGTTRDAVDETVEREGAEVVFVDTAGIRRKGKTKEMAEKLSVVMARRHIRMANVVLLVLDASEGVVGLDATIGGYAHEDGRAIIIVVNKWDLKSEKERKQFTELVRD